MPLKPLAAKAFVFNRNFVDDVASSLATEPDLTEDELGFYIDFPKMLGHVYGDIVGLEVHLCFVRTSPAGGASSEEMSSTRLRWRRRRQPLLRQLRGRMVSAPLTSFPRLLPVRVPKLTPAILRPSRAPCSALQLLSQATAADEK